MPCAHTRSTCTMTKPFEFFAAIASARLSSVSASRSIVMLPPRSAVVPRSKRHRDGKGFIEQPFLAVDLASRAPDRRWCASLILPPCWRGSTNVRSPTLVKRTCPVSGDVAKQLTQGSQRQVVCLDAAFHGHRRELRHESPMSADARASPIRLGRGDSTAILASRRVPQRTAASDRAATPSPCKALLQRRDQFVGRAAADKARVRRWCRRRE